MENWLNALIEKIKNHDPAEDEVEEGEPPKKWLTDLEEKVQACLLDGSGPSLEISIAILKEQLISPAARTKGFILDLHYFPKENEDSWAKIIRLEDFLGPQHEDGSYTEFTHIIELDYEDEEVKHRASGMLLDPSDGVVYSHWEISERNKPKPKKYDEDGNEIEEEEEEDENAPKKLNTDEMTQRVNDTDEFFLKELNHYN